MKYFISGWYIDGVSSSITNYLNKSYKNVLNIFNEHSFVNAVMKFASSCLFLHIRCVSRW